MPFVDSQSPRFIYPLLALAVLSSAGRARAEETPPPATATAVAPTETAPAEPVTEPPSTDTAPVPEAAAAPAPPAPTTQPVAPTSDVAKPSTPAKMSGRIYGGLATTPLKIKGLADVDASDWQSYGFGSSEGRVALPLAKGNTQGTRFGVRAGYEIGELVPFGIEVGLFPASSITAISGTLGVALRPIHTERFSFEIGPRIGYMLALMTLGKAHVLPGKTPPVVTNEGTFNEGDDLSARVSGFMAQFGASADVKLAGHVGLRLNGGYQLGFLNTFAVTAGDVELKKDSQALRKPGSAAAAQLDPSGSASGVYGMLGICYEL